VPGGDEAVKVVVGAGLEVRASIPRPIGMLLLWLKKGLNPLRPGVGIGGSGIAGGGEGRPEVAFVALDFGRVIRDVCELVRASANAAASGDSDSRA
jgi:hypothetical protein